jgi:hypothetical protein
VGELTRAEAVELLKASALKTKNGSAVLNYRRGVYVQAMFLSEAIGLVNKAQTVSVLDGPSQYKLEVKERSGETFRIQIKGELIDGAGA